MRKFFLLILVLAAAAVGFAMSNLKASARLGAARVADELKAAGGLELELGPVGLRFLPYPAVELADLRVAAGRRAAVEVSRLRVRPRLLPLLAGRVELAWVEAIEPSLSFLRDPSGNIDGLDPILAAASAFDRLRAPLRLSSGRLEYEDLTREGPPKVTVEGIEAEVRSRGDVLLFSLQAMPFGASSTVAAEGKLRARSGPTGGHGLDIDFSLDNAEAASLVTAFPLLAPLEINGPSRLSGSATGYLGEQSSQEQPAEPLRLKLKASSRLGLFGRDQALEMELEAAADGERVRLNRGSLTWGLFEFAVAGWTETRREGRVSLRLAFDGMDAGQLLAVFAVDEQWRPRASVGGTLRVGGTRSDPHFSYQAAAEKLVLALPWGGPELSSGPLSVSGNLATVNADFSGSFRASDLRLGAAEVPSAVFGLSYWRDKLTLTALDIPLWGGKASLTGAYYPGIEGSLECGGLFENLDVAQAARALVGTDGATLGGRLDSIVRAGRDERGLWVLGRLGLHEGSWQGAYLGPRMLPAPAFNETTTDLLASGADGARAAGRFRSLKIDFQTKAEGLRLSRFDIESATALLKGQGLVAADGAFTGGGVVSFDRETSGELGSASAAVGALVAGDGVLHMPVLLEGSTAGLKVRGAPGFIDALERASAGLEVIPFAAAEREGELSGDLPSLEDHFGR